MASYLEEYSPKLYHIEGIKNVIADNLSRLGRSDESQVSVGKNSIPIDVYKDTNKLNNTPNQQENLNPKTQDAFYSMST